MNRLNFYLKVFFSIFIFLSNVGANTIQNDSKTSFIVAGHTYGASNRKTIGLHPPFVENFDKIKQKKYDFGVFTGDIVRASNKAFWDKVDNQLIEIEMPIYFAPGNHDLLNKKIFTDRYGKNNKMYFAFEKNNDLFIILDNSSNTRNIKNEQLAFLKKQILNAKKDCNIFIFFHWIMWSDKNNKYKNVDVNMRVSSKTNFWTELVPIFKETDHNVYLFAGDTGGNIVHLPHYDKLDNIHLIAGGMGGGKFDNYTEVKIYNDGSVEMKFMFLQTQKILSVDEFKVKDKIIIKSSDLTNQNIFYISFIILLFISFLLWFVFYQGKHFIKLRKRNE